jgi:hypothetical protein
MPPTRPVDGAATETDWGQAVHDAVFTPRGTRVAGGASTPVGTTFEQLQLNTAVDDPGGWLASDALTVPVAGGGLYLYSVDVQTDNGEADERTRVQLRLNGTPWLSFFMDNDGTNAVTDGRTGLIALTAGDVITVYAAKTGGTDPDVLVRSLAFVRHGEEIGA